MSYRHWLTFCTILLRSVLRTVLTLSKAWLTSWSWQTERVNTEILKCLFPFIFRSSGFECVRQSLVPCTLEKSALIPSWDSVERMVLHVWDTAPLVQAGSDRVLDREARSAARLAWSFPVPSWRTSKEELMFSRASLVSRMATRERERMKLNCFVLSNW